MAGAEVGTGFLQVWLAGKRGEGDGFAGGGGLPGGVEDLHDDEVGAEGGEVAVGLDLSAEDGGEVVE